MTDIRDLLPLYALGILDDAEREVVDRAVKQDATLAAELDGLLASADQLLGIVAPVTPSLDVKARLLASAGGGRYERFAGRMASLFDVSIERAQELLGLIERPASWEVQIPGIHLVHFRGGPTYTEADCGFVRVEVGATFPPHTHMGEELSVILSGRIRDHATGLVRGPGDELLHAETTGHHLTCEGDEPCIYAARAMNGIEVNGTSVRPGRC